MKLRLPHRMGELGGWIAVAGLSAPLVLVIGLPIIAFPLWLLVTSYLVHVRGYGVGCSTTTISDSVSPSGGWTARVERVDCFTLSMDDSGVWIEVAVFPNDRPRFLARRREVFHRSLEGAEQSNQKIVVG